jgi:hypothetical protein
MIKTNSPLRVGSVIGGVSYIEFGREVSRALCAAFGLSGVLEDFSPVLVCTLDRLIGVGRIVLKYLKYKVFLCQNVEHRPRDAENVHGRDVVQDLHGPDAKPVLT